METVNQAIKHNAIDHIVFNTRDETDAAVHFFERAGFTVTPRGHHTLGSINHTIVFGTDYLELLGYPADQPPAQRPELVARPCGLMATVLQSVDADASHAVLAAHKLHPRPVQTFSRPVDLGRGRTQDAAFRVTRLEPDAVPGTWFYYCQHLTRDLVWRREWQMHPNGALGMNWLEIDVPDLGRALPLYAHCLSGARIEHAKETVGGSGSSADIVLRGCVLRLRELPGAARMRVLRFQVESLDRARRLLDDNRIAHGLLPDPDHLPHQLIEIDPAASFGATLQLSASANR